MSHHEHPHVQLVREGLDAVARGDLAWMDAHLADDITWHVGGDSKWAGTYQGKAEVLAMQQRQSQAMGSVPDVDVHDILGNDEHVVVLGSARGLCCVG